ncbi:MAG TPA: hypothetical protein VHP33_01700 [Polyangiaceae bacterium]|nr:hypothetical protein [Polyangiaceae bacterium]
MRRIGWWLLAAATLASACQDSKTAPDEGAAANGSAGKGGSAESSGGGGQLSLGVSGSLATAGIGAAASNAGRPPVDLSTVVAPLVRCHGEDGAGGQVGDASRASAGEAGAPAEGGARWDDDCAPPPSRCVDDLTLVYFDQGECSQQRCTWQKMSLTCQNRCQDTGCQDSITTK